MKDPHDVLGDDGRVRVLSRRCDTCIFRRGSKMHLRSGAFEDVVQRNIKAGALLTCHSTLPFGDHPDFGPAVCAGSWAEHGLETPAGRMAKSVLGITRVPPP